MRKLSLSTKVFYGIGQHAEGIKGAAFSMALLFYYTQVLGLKGSLAGLALFLALCCDAVTDPIAGWISDNFRSRWGRRHPFMYASAIPLAVCFYLVFAPPVGLGQVALFAWLLFFAIATRISMTLFHVPHMALGAELTEDYVDRTGIVGYRTFFSYLGMAGAVIVTFIYFFAPTPEYPNGQLNPAAYPGFARLGSIIMFISIWLSSLGTHKEIPYLPKPPLKPVPFNFMQVFRDMLQTLRNHTFRLLFIGSILGVIAGGIQVSLMLHLGTYFWELSGKQIIYIFVAVALGSLIGAPCTKYSNRRLDKKLTLLFGLVLSTLFNIAPIVLRLLDLFPANDDPLMLPLFIFFVFLATFVGVQAGVTSGSIVADVVDEHELITGRRQEGIFFGAQSFVGKALHGLGVTFAGIGLDLINFPLKAEPGTVDPEIIRNFGLLFTLTPAVTSLAAFIFFYRIRISRHSHARTLAELEILRTGLKKDP